MSRGTPSVSFADSSLGEGAYGMEDGLANRIEHCIDLLIGKPQDRNAVFLQQRRAHGVMGGVSGLIVLRTVDLDRELCFMTIKIHDKGTYDLLPLKAHRTAAQKVVPQMVFLRRRALAQRLGVHGQLFVIRKRQTRSLFSGSLSEGAVAAGD